MTMEEQANNQVWTQKDIDECVEHCSRLAETDMDFRLKLIDNPYLVLQEYSGKPVPEGIKIRVLESDPNYDYTFLLADPISNALSEQELDDIYAGGGPSCDSFHSDNCHTFCVCHINCNKVR